MTMTAVTTENFFFFSSNGVCSVDCPGSTGWLCARHFYPLDTLKDSEVAPIPFSYPFARAPFFIPLTFLNALLIPLGRVSPANAAAAIPRIRLRALLIARIIKFFSRRLCEFSVVVRRDAP